MKKYSIIDRAYFKLMKPLWNGLPDNMKIAISNRSIIGALDYSEAEIKMIVTSLVSYTRLNSCKKEPLTISWIKQNLTSDGVLYDIGANTGAYSLIASTMVGDRGKVVSFEPVPSTFTELCQNIQLNHFEERITALNIALNETNIISEFGLNSFSGGVGMHMGLSKEAILSNSNNTVFNYMIKTMTLDSVVNEFNLPLPTMIKIDVDGPEFQILKGASAVLKSKSLISLQVEIDQINQPVEEIVSYLGEHGLMLKEKHEHGNGEISDFVFHRKG